jgi:hypothetical protein
MGVDRGAAGDDASFYNMMRRSKQFAACPEPLVLVRATFVPLEEYRECLASTPTSIYLHASALV